MEHFDWLKGFIFPYINFALFLFLAVKLFKKPIVGALGARKKLFQDLIEEAAKAKKEAEETNRVLNSRLAGLDAEIKNKIDQARELANAEARLIVAKAEELAQRITLESKRIAEAEIAAANARLKSEIINQVKNSLYTSLGQMEQTRHLAILKDDIKAVADINVKL